MSRMILSLNMITFCEVEIGLVSKGHSPCPTQYPVSWKVDLGYRFSPWALGEKNKVQISNLVSIHVFQALEYIILKHQIWLKNSIIMIPGIQNNGQASRPIKMGLYLDISKQNRSCYMGHSFIMIYPKLLALVVF